jgi:hypothetical protein
MGPRQPRRYQRGCGVYDEFLTNLPHVEIPWGLTETHADAVKIMTRVDLSRALCALPYNTLSAGRKAFLNNHDGCTWYEIPLTEQNRWKSLPKAQLSGEERAHLRRMLCGRVPFFRTKQAPLSSMTPSCVLR